jgi:hypothetical protein
LNGTATLRGVVRGHWALDVNRRGRLPSGAPVPIFACLRLALLSATLALTFWAPPPGVAEAQSKAASEYEVKAAFLYNFAKFVEWPESSFADAQSPLTICILGTDPFGHTLDDALEGKMIGNRRVKLERLKDPALVRQCHIAFVGSAEARHLPEIESRLRGANVLLVGESDGFAEGGGVLQFIIEDSHLRFVINANAAQRADLKLSAKLLALAKIVHDPPGGGNN